MIASKRCCLTLSGAVAMASFIGAGCAWSSLCFLKPLVLGSHRTPLKTRLCATADPDESDHLLQSAVDAEKRSHTGTGVFASVLMVGAAFLVAHSISTVPAAMARPWTQGQKLTRVRNVPAPVPPTPDENPFIRKLQEKSWKAQPEIRARNYLQTMEHRLMAQGLTNFFSPKAFVHWSPGSYKYDIVEPSVLKDAMDRGRIVEDLEMSDDRQEVKVYMYAKEEDQAWVTNNLGVYDKLELPDELKESIEECRRTPFPKYNSTTLAQEVKPTFVSNLHAPLPTLPMKLAATPTLTGSGIAV